MISQIIFKEFNMKKALMLVITTVFFFLSCTSTKNTEATPDVRKTSDDEIIISEKTENIEKNEKQENPKDNNRFSKSEYERSIEELKGETITFDEFQKTKKDILQVISELNKIIKNKDYQSWLDYLTPESKEYWSDPVNLANVATRLPVKGIKIRNLKDYFNYVFIPARLNSQVEEIRYSSKNVVKAVQPLEKEDLIFYVFENYSDNWLLTLEKN